MNILVIGGNGNIGMSVSTVLAQQHDVWVLCRHPRPRADEPARLHYIQADASDPAVLAQLQRLHRFSVVINFLIQTPEQAQSDIAVFHGQIDQYIYISSVTVYNRENTVLFTEQTALGNPFSAYGRRKLACETVFLDAWHRDGFPVTVVRPSQTYSGNRIPLSVKGTSCWSVVARILAEEPVIVHGDGTSIWVSTHSDDFAEGFTSLVGRSETLGEAYQITSDEWLTWNQMYRQLADLLHKPLHLVHITTDRLVTSQQYDWQTALQGDKQYSVLFDNSKLRKLAPDFSCRISMREGYQRYLDYMQAHPEQQQRDPIFDVWCDQVIQQGVIG